MKLTFSLPWPPTVNTYYRKFRGRMVIDAPGKQYRQEVQACVGNEFPNWEVPAISGRLRVSIVANPPDRRKRDLDNIVKSLLDSLTHAGVWLDDSQIDHLEIARTKELTGDVTVIVEEIDQ